MKKILLFGAGKSATFLIDYLLKNALREDWLITVVDANIQLAESKIGNAISGQAVSFDINNESIRRLHIEQADIVISLLPPSLHILVAKDCIHFKKNLLTASYVDDQMRSLRNDIESNGLLFLCEMGLDPGIDHMSAKKMIDTIHSEGGRITSFLSHCGGLVAPESDNNPWRYKISWNPRNVVLAGKAGAIYKEDGTIREIEYEELFSQKRMVVVPDHELLCWYPNRDSLSYIPVYGLESCDTFIRTTLRHPDFMYGWKNVIALHLTDEVKKYNTAGKSLKDFYAMHMAENGFGDWLQEQMQEQFASSKKILEDLVNLVELEEKAGKSGAEPMDEFMMVDEKGDLQEIDLDTLKTNAAATVANKMHEAKLTLKQLFFLGMDDTSTMIPINEASAADVLQLSLEKKLPLLPGDKDMVVMVHEIEYQNQGKNWKEIASLLITGENDQHTAMAKTVGLPLGIAAKLILNGTIREKGLLIPVTKEIYEPVLNELQQHGIFFQEQKTELT
ncbi:MAG TPA: saccharopine dehydrogenase C-terminal domain-containing protein [Flavisolibacter sp.]|nr:saccharopine dehydrogenase C-terminal domain-containing protein [Flavisolibacter sp.]